MFTRVADVRQFLLEHPVDPTTLGPYLYWDVGHYTRNLIDKTPFYAGAGIVLAALEVKKEIPIETHGSTP